LYGEMSRLLRPSRHFIFLTGNLGRLRHHREAGSQRPSPIDNHPHKGTQRARRVPCPVQEYRSLIARPASVRRRAWLPRCEEGARIRRIPGD
jgi:hypothetical protein